MSFEQVLFYTFGAVLIVAAIGVITARNPVHAVLWLVLAFFNSSILWMLLEAEFLAIVLVLVYVGAVMVLFLFVVMMLDINVASERQGFTRYAPLGALVTVIVAVEIAYVVRARQMGVQLLARPEPRPLDYSNTEEIGKLLYTEYVYAFEIAAVILLVAIVAAIALTMRRRPNLKVQNIAGQVATRRQDRVRMIKMKAETRE
ncbi:MAG: NADH-quinone oxidoreductase subunit J [Gammaproteobacteria bacterium]|nr:NADH-quinone oxidoreductase subunit J [Gammaproteobacteria bacterium]